jgi:hypothetical protein
MDGIDEKINIHIAPGDLANPASVGSIAPKSIVNMIDVDYYVEDWKPYLGQDNIVLAYTFNPVHVAGMDGDCPFTITDNHVNYLVGGGGVWRHRVHNWCDYGEFVKTPVDQTFLGINSWTSLFKYFFRIRKVMYHKITYYRPFPDLPHRAVIAAIPQYSHLECKWFESPIHARSLKRCEYIAPERPGWNRINYMEGNDQMVSVGRDSEAAHLEINKAHHDILLGLKTRNSVSSRMISLEYGKDQAGMALFGQYYDGENNGPLVSVDVAKASELRVYWPAHCLRDVPETPARSYTNAIVTDSDCVPQSTDIATASQSINRRIINYKNQKIPDTRYLDIPSEWASLVVGEERKHTGIPYTDEEVVDMLNKPKHMRAFEEVKETLGVDPRELVQGFYKMEACKKTPRMIACYKDFRLYLKMCCFTLKLRDEILHGSWNEHWFMPGHSPTEIANKVCEYVSSIGTPQEGDYTNLDGTENNYTHVNYIRFPYLYYFRHEYHDEIFDLFEILRKCPARFMKFGFKYDTGAGTMKSGATVTCDGNTYLAGSQMYAAIRQRFPSLPQKDAFLSVGLAFGDDTLFDVQYVKQWSEVARQHGQILKAPPHDPRLQLTYLSRVYVDPYATNTTVQDPLRTLRKCHLTFRVPSVPLHDAATDRAEGYLPSDRLTPLISTYFEKVISLYSGEASSAAKRASRKTGGHDQNYWSTQSDGAWPQDPAFRDEMCEVVAARLGISVETLETFEKKIEEATDPFQLPVLDRNEEPDPHKDTLDEDSLPAGGAVDEVQLLNDITELQERIITGQPLQSTTNDGLSTNQPTNGDTDSPGIVESTTTKPTKGPKPTSTEQSAGGDGPDDGTSVSGRQRDHSSATKQPHHVSDGETADSVKNVWIRKSDAKTSNPSRAKPTGKQAPGTVSGTARRNPRSGRVDQAHAIGKSRSIGSKTRGNEGANVTTKTGRKDKKIEKPKTKENIKIKKKS